MGPKIGSGSFGEIYAGTNVHTGEEVAIKVMRDFNLPFPPEICENGCMILF